MGFFKPEDFEGAGIPHTPTAADIANAKRDTTLKDAETVIIMLIDEGISPIISPPQKVAC